MQDDLAFGAIAVREGFLTQQQLDEALARRDGRPLAETLLERRLLTPEQIQAIRDILRIQAADLGAPAESGGVLQHDRFLLPCTRCDTYHLILGLPDGTRFVCRKCRAVLTVRRPAPPANAEAPFRTNCIEHPSSRGVYFLRVPIVGGEACRDDFRAPIPLTRVIGGGGGERGKGGATSRFLFLILSAGLIPACHRTPQVGLDPGTLRINVDLTRFDELHDLTFEVVRIDVALTSDPTQEGEWLTVSNERLILRLVGFPGLKPQFFASVVIPREGFVRQVRFIVESGQATWRGALVPVTLPSGEQTGLKAIADGGIIQIVDQAITDVTLRLDPEHSTVETRGQGLLVKPVVKLAPGAVTSLPINKFIEDRITVLFKDGIDEGSIAGIVADLRASIRFRDPYIPFAVLELPPGSDVLSVQAQLNELPQVAAAAPDFIGFVAGQQQTLPNDPFFAAHYQWGLHNTGNSPTIISPIADIDIDAPEAWTLTTGSPSVVVAVIDTGVDINHDDLRDNIWVNPGETGLDAMGRDKRTNGIDDDRNGYVDDIHGWNFGDGDNFVYDATGHGTGVAAVLGARGNNGLHLSGVAWNVRIMPIRIITRTGIIPASAVIQALSYAARNGASICNISWLAYLDGFQRAYYEPMFKSAIGSTLVICAAGNERTNLDSLTTLFAFPPMVSHPQKITVGAIMPNGEIPDWSNVGANYVDLAAPGSEIFTVLPGGGFTVLDGTSFSAPFAAGTAALIQSRFPTLDALTVKERILNGVDVDLKYSGRFRKKGRLNAFNSVQ